MVNIYDNRKPLSGQHFKQTKRTISPLKSKPKEDISGHKIQSFHINKQTGIRRLVVSSILKPGCLAEKLSQSMMLRDLRLQHHLPDSSSWYSPWVGSENVAIQFFSATYEIVTEHFRIVNTKSVPDSKTREIWCINNHWLFLISEFYIKLKLCNYYLYNNCIGLFSCATIPPAVFHLSRQYF